MQGSVLHISACDDFGGSGRSAFYIHKKLKSLGWRSRMLVARKFTDDQDVALIWKNLLWRGLDRICREVGDRLGLVDLLYPSSFALARHPWFREAGIIQLYNIHGGYFNFMALPQLSMLRPVVWHLSDMWAMTGHCTFSYGCERWKTGCGLCPILDEDPVLRRDTTSFLWRSKRWAYRHSRLTVVTPSRWLGNLVSESPLLRRFPVHIIPNGVDTKIFRPIQKGTARELLGLPTEDLIILFSARSVVERRKGGFLLREVAGLLKDQLKRPFTFIVVGSGAEQWESMESIRVKLLGFVSDAQLLAAVYAASDVFVLPTLADNVPNSLIESMACGTPSVAFDVGGCSEIVRHMETGYLARPGDNSDFVRGCCLLLENHDLLAKMAARCRKVAEEEYSLDLRVSRYVKLYQKVLSRPGGGSQQAAGENDESLGGSPR